MAKVKKHIEIVRTGTPALSSMSQESCDSIFAALSKHYAQVGVTVINTLADLQALVTSQPDLVFLGVKFILNGSQKIWLADYLDQYGIAYTGSSSAAHKLEFNKALAKQRTLDMGLPTSLYYVARQTWPQSRLNMPLTFPLFVKPTNRGGGVGIDHNSVVNDFEQLESKVLSIATNYQSDSLVEEYLTGREFSVAILKELHSDDFSIMPIELIAQPDKNGSRLLSNSVKSSNTEQAIEVIDKTLEAKISALAIDIFYALEARDYGRIDIRLDKFGIPQFLEANLIPSLIAGYGSFPKACEINISLGYETMIIQIAELGLTRNVDVIENVLEARMPSSITPPSLTIIESL